VLASDVEHARLSVVLSGHRPDVAILDAGALAKAIEVQALSRAYPHTSLVLLDQRFSAPECAQLLAFGASACLGTDTQGRDVLNAIHLAARGLRVTPRGLPDHGAAAGASGPLLTRRESEVLPLLREGRSNSEIALALGVGVETVRTHTRNIYRKLGVSSRRQLIAPSGSMPPPVGPAPAREARVELAGAARRRASTITSLRQRGHGSRPR
jgi:DNA-binding NarL/FixJ family response regulator